MVSMVSPEQAPYPLFFPHSFSFSWSEIGLLEEPPRSGHGGIWRILSSFALKFPPLFLLFFTFNLSNASPTPSKISFSSIRPQNFTSFLALSPLHLSVPVQFFTQTHLKFIACHPSITSRFATFVRFCSVHLTPPSNFSRIRKSGTDLIHHVDSATSGGRNTKPPVGDCLFPTSSLSGFSSARLGHFTEKGFKSKCHFFSKLPISR